MKAGIIVEVTPEGGQRLDRIVGDRNSPQKYAARARVILVTADGCGTVEIMRRSGLSKPVVWRWQERFMREGVDGLLRDKTRPPGKAPDAKIVKRIVDLTLADPPGETTHWTEKSQIRALDRTQPELPMKKGRAGTMTHDYKRHGPTTLFAAFDVLEGKVIGRCMRRHRHQEFIRFLNAIEADLPAGKVVHVILDNYATHKHPKVMQCLDRHPRFTFHSDIVLVDQRRRRVLRHAQKASAEARRLPLVYGPASRYQSVP
jgi:hypothetical protein